MKKICGVIIFVFFVISYLSAIDTNVQTATTFPEDGVFEIITSSIKMSHTFMLNKITGETWQLVDTGEDYGWEPILRFPSFKKTKREAPKKDVPVFQITMSGIAARGAYLTNTATGESWVLYSDTESGKLFWGIIDFIE